MTYRIPSFVGWTHKSDLVLNARVIRFRSLKQALEKTELKLKAASDFVPAFTRITVANNVVSCMNPLMMVLHSVQGPHCHVESLADVHSVPRNLMQEEVVGLL
jgi:hypothetical protein